MIDRINLILKAKNITARQFAEEIGIQPSGMSHIMSGRNRPSLDFVMKVINRYPEIDIKWLTLGEGEMYAPSMTAVPAAPSNPVRQSSATVMNRTVRPAAEPDLFSSMEGTLFGSTVQESTPAEPRPQANPESLEIRNEVPVAPVQPVAEPTLPVVEQPTQEQPVPVKETPLPPAAPEVVETAPQPQLNENRVDAIAPAVIAENQNLKKKKIVKVVVLYDDHSFSEYYPE